VMIKATSSRARSSNKFTCRYNDVVVFAVDLHEAVAANPSSNSTCARRRAVASTLSGKKTTRRLRATASPHRQLTMGKSACSAVARVPPI